MYTYRGGGGTVYVHTYKRRAANGEKTEPWSIFSLFLIHMAATNQQSYYEVLGVDKTASSDQIKKAYRRLGEKFVVISI